MRIYVVIHILFYKIKMIHLRISILHFSIIENFHSFFTGECGEHIKNVIFYNSLRFNGSSFIVVQLLPIKLLILKK